MNCPRCQSKLENVKEVDDRMDYWCSSCKYGFTDEQLISKNCLRCGKKTSGIHTCSPTESYRAGYKEGYYTALKESNDKLEEVLSFLKDKTK